MAETRKDTPKSANSTHQHCIKRKRIGQDELLLMEFAKGNAISQLPAINELGIGHLSSVVSKMILDYGIPVQKRTKTSGTGARYTEYYMNKDEAADWLSNRLIKAKTRETGDEKDI